MPSPLDGIRILDLTIYQNGPWATVMLSDMGADVIKIEEPRAGDPGRNLRPPDQSVGAYFETMNRNKRSMTLDLRQEQGRQVFYRMAPRADVVVQNFRLGVAERLGVDYATLSKHNPRIICASVTGFGRRGPHARHRVFDSLGQGRGGLIDALRREPGARLLPGPGGIADQTGAIMLAYSIMLALFARERFGIGQDVEVSQLGSQLVLQGLGINRYLFDRQPPRQRPWRETQNPLFTTYRCKDGRWLVLAAVLTDAYWVHFCKGIGRDDLATDPRFATQPLRNRNGSAIIEVLDSVFATRTREEWLEHLYSQDVICTPVQSYADLESDPQVVANEYIVEVDHPLRGKMQQVGVPSKLSATPGRPRRAAPPLGQHTGEVLREFGFSQGEVEELRMRGVT